MDLGDLELPDASLDAALLVKVYPICTGPTPGAPGRKWTPSKVLEEVARVLKPGRFCRVDHSAKPGTGKSDAGSSAPIDEAYARSDFEAHGFQFVVARATRCASPEDAREQISYSHRCSAKTDRICVPCSAKRA